MDGGGKQGLKAVQKDIYHTAINVNGVVCLLDVALGMFHHSSLEL